MKTILVLAIALFLVSCSHKEHKKEIEKRAEQSTVKDPQTFSSSIDQAIENSPHLTAEQKTELHNIIAANKKRAMELTEQSYKMRGVLIDELLSEKMSSKKVKLIKKQIKQIENDKLKNTFDTVEQITKLVSGHSDSKDFSSPLMNMDMPLR